MEEHGPLRGAGDASVIELVTDGFAVPGQCACCLGPATVSETAWVESSAPSALTLLTIWFGHVAFNTERQAWTFPSCGACARHASMHRGRFKWLFVLAFFSSIILFCVLACNGDVALSDEELYTKSALYTVGIETFLISALYMLVGRLAMLGTSAGCHGPRPAVVARLTWDSTVQFRFRNRAFAEQLLEVNRPGALREQPEGQVKPLDTESP